MTHAKSVFLAASPDARKTSGTQAKSADVGTENKGAYRKSELAGWLVLAKKQNGLSLRVFAKNLWSCFKVAGYSAVKPKPPLPCVIFRNGMIWLESYD